MLKCVMAIRFVGDREAAIFGIAEDLIDGRVVAACERPEPHQIYAVVQGGRRSHRRHGFGIVQLPLAPSDLF